MFQTIQFPFVRGQTLCGGVDKLFLELVYIYNLYEIQQAKKLMQVCGCFTNVPVCFCVILALTYGPGPATPGPCCPGSRKVWKDIISQICYRSIIESTLLLENFAPCFLLLQQCGSQIPVQNMIMSIFFLKKYDSGVYLNKNILPGYSGPYSSGETSRGL